MSTTPLQREEQEWVDMAVAAGMRVVDATGEMHDGTSQAEREAAKVRVERESSGELGSIIPIRPEVPDHEVVVTCMDGSIVRVHPALKYGTLHKSEWIAQQIAKREKELEDCDDADTADVLFAAIHTLERDSLKLSVPDLPSDLLERLDQVQYNDLLMVVQRMTRDAQKAVSDHQKKFLAPYLVKSGR